MKLRDVTIDDIDTYIRMRCDPELMSELGGPFPPEGIPEKVRADVESVRKGEAWICMIVPDPASPEIIAGNVVMWSHGDDPISEIGWMVLPEFQGRGIGKGATRMLLERARDENRWGMVHAFPGVTNGPSNGICKGLGFQLVGTTTVPFNNTMIHSNHWVIDPSRMR